MTERIRYEPPMVEELGSLEEVTLMPNKVFGPTDGFTFNGVPVRTS